MQSVGQIENNGVLAPQNAGANGFDSAQVDDKLRKANSAAHEDAGGYPLTSGEIMRYRTFRDRFFGGIAILALIVTA